MENIDWNDSYAIDIEHIDRQHQRLFNLVNLFFETLAMDTTAALIQPVLSGLATYVKTHFRDEEAEMQRLAYPALDEHRQKHQQLTAQVQTLCKQLQDGLPIDKPATAAFLKDWLISHVMQDDKKIGVYAHTTNDYLQTI